MTRNDGRPYTLEGLRDYVFSKKMKAGWDSNKYSENKYYTGEYTAYCDILYLLEEMVKNDNSLSSTS